MYTKPQRDWAARWYSVLLHLYCSYLTAINYSVDIWNVSRLHIFKWSLENLSLCAHACILNSMSLFNHGYAIYSAHIYTYAHSAKQLPNIWCMGQQFMKWQRQRECTNSFSLQSVYHIGKALSLKISTVESQLSWACVSVSVCHRVRERERESENGDRQWKHKICSPILLLMLFIVVFTAYNMYVYGKEICVCKLKMF